MSIRRLQRPTRFRSWHAVALHLGLSALRAEFGAARDRFATVAAEFGFGSGSYGCSEGRSRFPDGVHHGLAHGHARTEARTHSDRSSAFIRGCDGNGLRHLVLRELAHIAEYGHADALVEHFLQLLWQRKIFDHKAVQGQPIFREGWFEGLADFFCKRA